MRRPRPLVEMIALDAKAYERRLEEDDVVDDADGEGPNQIETEASQGEFHTRAWAGAARWK